MATTYRLVNALDAPDAAYIAGLVDGEGTVTLSGLHRNENRRLVLCLSNNDLALLQHVKDKIGAGRITSKRVYMRSYKFDRARLALRDYLRVTPRNGRYTADVAAARHRFETALLSIRPRRP